MADRRTVAAAAVPDPAAIADPEAERALRRRGRDRAVLLAALGCAALMFALALLHAGGR